MISGKNIICGILLFKTAKTVYNMHLTDIFDFIYNTKYKTAIAFHLPCILYVSPSKRNEEKQGGEKTSKRLKLICELDKQNIDF